MTLIANVDVAVIGAGIAGLSAAHNLQLANDASKAEPNVSYAVIEALDRVGGKVLSIPAFDDGSDFPVVDEGAAFINVTEHTMMKWLGDRYGVKPITTYTSGWGVSETSEGVDRAQSGLFVRSTLFPHLPSSPLTKFMHPQTDDPIRLANLLGMITYIDSYANDVNLHDLTATPDAERLDNLSLEEFFAEYEGYDDWLRQFMQVYIHGVLGGQLDQISALFWLQYTKSSVNSQFLAAGAQDQRPDLGSMAYARGMASELQEGSLHLSSPVKSIKYNDKTQLHTIKTKGGNTFEALHVIVTLPSPLLSTIEFDPPLPPPKQKLAKTAVMGFTNKALPIWKEPWWRKSKFGGMLSSSLGPVSVSIDSCNDDAGLYALTGFVIADPKNDWVTLPDEERKDRLMEQLNRTFGSFIDEPIPEPERIIYKTWVTEEYFWGGPTALAPPGLLTSDAGKAWREKWGTVSFIGTETAYEFMGYMEGAYRSGIRGANEALAAIGLPPVSIER